ncbi:MAG: alpha/beta hydrolase [Hyphomicrobiales bacterium]|nr:alpha/beta hydrolase [Hyphomicrobiales bacterium]
MSLLNAFLKAPSAGSLFSLAVSQRGGRIDTGIAYGDHPRHKLDIYSPADGKTVQAIVIFIYGGGWDSGQRQMYGFVGSSLAARGYLAIVPDYRLFPEVRYPDFMADISAAYQWVVTEKAANSEVPIIMMGHSAGAHMAALLTYDTRYIDSCDTSLVRPHGFIGMSGPYGFDAKAHERTKDIFSTAHSEHEVKPVARVTQGAPHALLFHGRKDTTVLTLNAIRLREALQAAGSDAEVVEIEQAGHLGPLFALSRPYERKFNILPIIDRFIAAT